MNVGVTFTDIDLLGKRLSVADAKALLSPLDRNDVLVFCAYLNGVNETGIGPGVAWDRPEHVQRLQVLLHSLLPPVHHKRALRLAATSQLFCPLESSALRALMKLACLWCPSSGGKHLESVRYRQNVAKVLFGLQGALVNEVPVGNADLDWVYRAFPGVTRFILANPRLDLGHDIGRLHGIIARQAVGALLEREHNGLTVDAWFKQELQVSARDYRRIAQGLTGYAGRFAAHPQNLGLLWLDFVPFRNSFPGLEKQVQFIWELAEATVDEVVPSRATEPTSLSEVVYDPKDVLLVKPLLRIGERYLVTSYDAVFSKFVRGLPYLAYGVAQKRGVTGGKLQMGARDLTGRIFEGYVRWLTCERFCGSDVKVFCGYQINAPQQRKGHMNSEGDVLLIVGDIAYPIEVKAKVPTLADRASGDLVCLANLVDGLSLQAATAAVALVKEECRTEDGSQIPAVRKAYPCVLVFERFPIRYPFSDAFEQELSKKPNRSLLFADSPTVGPLQVFDIDSYEDWDKAYRLPNETRQLFDALKKRATTPRLRYESLLKIRDAEGGEKPTWKSILDKLCDESEVESKEGK